MKFVDLMVLPVLRVHGIHVCDTKVRFMVLHKGKVQTVVSTDHRLLVTEILQVSGIVAHGVKGADLFHELVDLWQHVSHAIRVKIFHQAPVVTVFPLDGWLVMQRHPVFAGLTRSGCVDNHRALLSRLLLCYVLCEQAQLIFGQHPPEVLKSEVMGNVHHFLITEAGCPPVLLHVSHVYEVQVVVTLLFLCIVICSLNSAQTNICLLAAGLLALKHSLRPK